MNSDGRITTYKRAVPRIKPVLIEGGEYIAAELKTTVPREQLYRHTWKTPAVPEPCCVHGHCMAEPKYTGRKRALPVKTPTPQKYTFFRVSKLRESKGKPLPLSRPSSNDDEASSSCDKDAAWTTEAKAVLAREREPPVPGSEDEPIFTQLLAECC